MTWGLTMKRLSAVFVVVGLFVAAPTASAHKLTKTRAEWRAQTEAKLFADEGEAYTWGDCRYRSSHTRRCTIASYDVYADITCDAYVYVRFVSRRSYRTWGGRWFEIDCYEGDHYDLAEYADGSGSEDGF